LRVQILFQDKRVGFFFLTCGKPHQIFLNIASRSRQKDFGKRNKDIVYVGIAFATVLIKVVLPAWESNFDFQPESKKEMGVLAFKSSNAIFFLLCKNKGMPRYLDFVVLWLRPKDVRMVACKKRLQFLLKKDRIFLKIDLLS
jgi:hypothetical protein